MPLRKRRTATSNGVWAVAGPFIPLSLLLVVLIGRQIYLTLHRNTLFEAIRRNDTEAAIGMLRAGADPNGRETPPAPTFNDFAQRYYEKDTASDYTTPLLAALYTVQHPGTYPAYVQINPHPNLAIIRALLERGADVQAIDNWQEPPIAYAVSGGDVAVVELLVQYGAKVEVPNSRGFYLLQAAGMGNTNVARWLLEHGADVNAVNSNGQSALMYAAMLGRSPDSVQLLLAHHANVHAKDRFGHTALWQAQHPNPRLAARHNQHLPEIIALLKQAVAR